MLDPVARVTTAIRSEGAAALPVSGLWRLAAVAWIA